MSEEQENKDPRQTDRKGYIESLKGLTEASTIRNTRSTSLRMYDEAYKMLAGIDNTLCSEMMRLVENAYDIGYVDSVNRSSHTRELMMLAAEDQDAKTIMFASGQARKMVEEASLIATLRRSKAQIEERGKDSPKPMRKVCGSRRSITTK